jgi:gliding motility-associated-like protein
VFTVENVDDVNCTLTSPSQTLESCGCFGSDPFCAPDAGEALIFPNVDDSSGTEADPNLSNYGCLFTQPNPVWYFMQIDQSGELVFEIVQNTQFDANGNPTGQPLDVDFIAWGPFTDTQYCNDLDSCDTCGSNPFDNNYPYGNVIDCSYSAAPVETFTIPNAQAGEIYAVLITNFNGDPGFISLGQTNSSNQNSGSTDCDIILQNQVLACTGDNVTLTAADTTADQYQWLVFNESTQVFDPIAGETTQTTTVNEAGLYQILTLNGTEVSTEEFTVELIPEPEHNLPQQITLCSNQTETLDASILNIDQYDAAGHQWSENGTPIPGETQSTLVVTQPGTYSVEITTTNENVDTDGNDLTCTHNFDITVNSADYVVDLGGSQNYCETTSQTITANVSGADATNASYLWSTNETTPSIQVSDSGTYEVTVTIDGCSVIESVVYTFAEEPQFDLGPNQNLCEGENTILDASVSNNTDFSSISYTWSDFNGPIAGETSSTLQVTTQGTFTVEVTTTTTTSEGVEFECITEDSITITGAVFDVEILGDLTICDPFEPIDLEAIITGADSTSANYQWSTNESGNMIQVTESGTYTVTVTINGCSETASADVVINFSPDTVLGPDTVTCDLTLFELDATPLNYDGGNITYQWSYNGQPLNETSALLNPDDYGFGTYEVSVYFDDPNCNTTDNITFTQRDISVSITSDDIDNLFCLDETVTFNASLQNAEVAEAEFEWFVNGVSQGNNLETLENYQITDTSLNQNVSVQVTIGTECLASDQLSFSLYDVDNCVISQGVSPNGDNVNDNLDLRFLDDRSGISSLEVFNRYGQKVYEKINYRNEFFGQSDNGNSLETGTYFYVIKFENEDPQYGRVHKGWIYINREQ